MLNNRTVIRLSLPAAFRCGAKTPLGGRCFITLESLENENYCTHIKGQEVINLFSNVVTAASWFCVAFGAAATRATAPVDAPPERPLITN
jgi:hypothetical protein